MERFIARLRDDLLDDDAFHIVAGARALIDRRPRHHYGERLQRPHRCCPPGTEVMPFATTYNPAAIDTLEGGSD